MMCPESLSTMPGARRRVKRISAVTLVSSIVATSARSKDWAGSLPKASPALLMRMSMTGWEARAAWTAAASVTSTTSTVTDRPGWADRSLSASASSSSVRRAQRTRAQPAAASSAAMASPMPEDAPVIRAVRPAMDGMVATSTYPSGASASASRA